MKKILSKFSAATMVPTMMLVGMFSFITPAMASTDVVYNAIPTTLAPNYPSQPFQAQQTNEFGDYVHLGGTARNLDSVTVTMDNWALQTTTANVAFCAAASGNCDSTGFFWPITVNIYSNTLDANDAPNTVLATKTETVHIPWRPAEDSVNCPTKDSGGYPYKWQSTPGAVDTNCYNGIAANVTVDMSDLGVTLPDDVIVGFVYDTETYGPVPTGVDGPYNSLNIALPPSDPVTAGTDDNADRVFWNTDTATYYTNLVCTGGTFCEDSNWGVYGTVPIQINATSPVVTTILVKPTDMHGWYLYDDQTDTTQSDTADHGFVTGPATPPIGTGSVHLTKTTTDKYGIATSQFAGTALSDISALSFSTYRASGTSAQAPSLGFDVDTDNTIADTVYQGRLTYEPYFTQTVNTSVWQTWDTLNDTAGNGTGNWWFSHAGGNVTTACTQTDPCTWTEVLAAFPHAAIRGVGQLILRTNGADNEVFDGNVDNLTVGILNTDTIFNFEPEPVIPAITIDTQKVVCDSEAALPNWGSAHHTIDANTAQSWVAQSDGHCSLTPNWNFQWGPAGAGSTGDFQTNTSELGSPWHTFTGSIQVPLSEANGNHFEVREVFPDDSYVPFSNDSGNNVSAEIYCTGDSANYDNWEWLGSPTDGSTYNCVAFNALKDTHPPVAPSITHGPANPTNSIDANFSFTDSEDSVTFQCTIDGDGPHDCDDGNYDVTVAEGSHIFDVTAKDASGNTSEATEFTWTVDTTAPTVEITAGPQDPTPTNDSTPTFSFTSADGTAAFTCKIDDGAEDACVSPFTTSALLDGAHTFTVKATDTAGNVGSASRTFTVDTQGPTVSIDSGPTGTVENADATFTFSSEAGVTFTCQLDGGALETNCTSPKNYTSLSDAEHTFKVFATDGAGNAGDPASRTWTVDAVGPVITLQSAGDATDNSITVTWTTDELSTSRVVYDTVSVPTVGSAPDYGYAFSTDEDATLTTTHSVVVTGLSSGTTYYFRGVSHGSPETVSDEVSDTTTTPAPDHVQVTIAKFIGDEHATADNADSATFTMQADYNFTNEAFPSGISGSDPYTLSTVGSNTDVAYEAKTLEFYPGANYATHEITDGSVVVPTDSEVCPVGKYRLLGYKTGATFEEAQAATMTTDAPAFTGLEGDEYVIVVNEKCVDDTVTTATINVTKIVCDNEADLPNWGAGGPDVTATTASQYVIDHPTCHIVPWTFEWAPDGTTNPGDQTGVAGGAWTAFTGGSTTVPSSALTWVREEFDDAYIPFTGQNTDQDVSAELYCNQDVLNYDNYDFISPTIAGETYNCVGFNVLKPQQPSDVTVTIAKYIHADGTSPATAENTDSSTFPITSTWNAENIGAGSGSFSLGPVGFNNPNPYQATTADMTSGADYSIVENVGTECTADNQDQYVLEGYKIGDSESDALAAEISPTASLSDITSNKFIIVVNKKCGEVLGDNTLTVHIYKYLTNDNGDPTQLADDSGAPSFPMTATWQAANLDGGVSTSGNYVLGTNYGGTTLKYAADTAPMWAPADYTTSEVADGDVVVANSEECSVGKYYLDGYKSSLTSLADAETSAISSTAPAFTGLSADAYVIVVNTKCPDKTSSETGTIIIQKYTDDAANNGTFTFTGLTDASITTLNGTGEQTFENLPTGTYNISEVAQSGWTQDEGASCSNGDDTEINPSSVTLGDGDIITCVFNNTKDTPPTTTGKLVIIKKAIGGNGTFNFDGDDLGEFSITTHHNIGVKSIKDIPIGTYSVTENTSSGWTEISNSCDNVTVTANHVTVCKIVNKKGHEQPPHHTATINATKIVCANESDLPNWGAGGPDITSSTATDFLAAHPHCYLTPWYFEWAPGNTTNPGNQVDDAGHPWKTFSSTATVPSGSKIWVREQFFSDYIPFSGWVSNGSNTPTTDDQNSAEFYCNKDVLNYDNFDNISPVVAGQTYNCIGFNVPTTHEVPDDTASITVIKNTDSPDNNGTFHFTDGGETTLDLTTVSGTASDSFTVTPDSEGTSYDVVETNIPQGWDFSSVECVYDGGAGVSGPLHGETITLEPGEHATCTFVNTKQVDECLATDVETDYSSDGTETNAKVVSSPNAGWATISGAQWIWNDTSTSDEQAQSGDTQTFTRTFHITDTPLDSSITFAADNGYDITVNGHEIASDPSEHNYGATQTVPIPAADLIANDDNVLSITITNLAFPAETGESNPAGVIYKLNIHENDCAQQPPVDECPVGQHESDNECVPDEQSPVCPEGQTADGNDCVCPVGSEKDGDNCDPIETPTCTAEQPEGTNDCVCPQDEVANNDGFCESTDEGGSTSDLSITKVADDGDHAADGTVVYTIIVTNSGDEANNIVVIDNLPESLTYAADSETSGTYDSGSNIWTIPSLADGASATLTLTTTIGSEEFDSTITNTASVTSDNDDTDSQNDSASATITTDSQVVTPQTKKSSIHHSGGSTGISSVGQVLGAEDVCSLSIATYMRKGYKNNMDEVKILQAFLNDEMGLRLTVDGVFGAKTEAAVMAFQLKYRADIMDPWHLTAPTGIVYKTTLVKIKNLMCSANNLPVPTDLIPWSANQAEVPPHA